MNQSTPEQIKTLLQQTFNTTRLELTDNSHLHVGHSGNVHGGGHYAVVLQSADFDGVSTIKRHQSVYQAVNALLESKAIHALEIKALDSQGN